MPKTVKDERDLTAEDMNKILVDLSLERKAPRVTGKGADVFRKKLKKEIEEIESRGVFVEVPGEWLE